MGFVSIIVQLTVALSLVIAAEGLLQCSSNIARCNTVCNMQHATHSKACAVQRESCAPCTAGHSIVRGARAAVPLKADHLRIRYHLGRTTYAYGTT